MGVFNSLTWLKLHSLSQLLVGIITARCSSTRMLGKRNLSQAKDASTNFIAMSTLVVCCFHLDTHILYSVGSTTEWGTSYKLCSFDKTIWHVFELWGAALTREEIQQSYTLWRSINETIIKLCYNVRQKLIVPADTKVLLSSTSLYIAALRLPSIDSGLDNIKCSPCKSFLRLVVSAKSLLKPSSDFDLIFLRVVAIVRTSLYAYSTSVAEKEIRWPWWEFHHLSSIYNQDLESFVRWNHCSQEKQEKAHERQCRNSHIQSIFSAGVFQFLWLRACFLKCSVNKLLSVRRELEESSDLTYGWLRTSKSLNYTCWNNN